MMTQSQAAEGSGARGAVRASKRTASASVLPGRSSPPSHSASSRSRPYDADGRGSERGGGVAARDGAAVRGRGGRPAAGTGPASPVGEQTLQDAVSVRHLPGERAHQVPH